MKTYKMLLGLALALFVFAGCNNSNKKNEAAGDELDTAETTTETDSDRIVYEADIVALNSHITGSEATGKATFTLENGQMQVVIDVKGVPANIEHWQHFHGFENADDATCANTDSDANGDGIIDLMETEHNSGTTMVPFNDKPEELNIPTDTYPVADEDGNYRYEATVNMAKLGDYFNAHFGDYDIHLDTRVLYIHGVPTDTDLPESVASLGDIPAHVTLPIACGKIVRVE